jgi:hypothetical protein
VYSEEFGTFATGYNDEFSSSSFKTGRQTAADTILMYTKPLSEQDKRIVRYPTVKKPTSPDSETYKWFSNNRGSVSRPTIEQVIPAISDDNKRLKKN